MINDSENFKKANLKADIKWLEVSHLKGVTVERGYNPFYEMCVSDQSQAWKGLVKYKYDKFTAREKGYRANFYRLAGNLVLRTYVLITSPYRLKITSPNQEEFLTDFRRLLVVENDLNKPAFGAYFEHDEAELLSMYSPRKWSIVDMDGIMKGNSILPKFDHLSQTFVF